MPLDTRQNALVIGLLYALFGGLWILLSDQALAYFISDPDLRSHLQTAKGWLFIAITSLLLYAGLTRRFQVRTRQDARHARHSAEALRRSEQHYRMLFEHSPLPMWAYSPDTLRFLDVNDAAIRQYGYSREEFLDMSLLDIRPEQERARLQALMQSLPEGTQAPGIWLHRHKSGRLMQMEVHSFGFTHEGQAARLVLALDITERLATEAALRRSEQRYRFVLDAVGDGFWDWELDTGSVFLSPRWKSMLGYRDEELENRIETWSSLVHPDDLPRANAEHQRHWRGESETYSCEYRMRTKSGHWLWILGRGRIVERDEHGQPLRMVGTNTDISVARRGLALREGYARIFEHIAGDTPLTSILTELVEVLEGQLPDSLCSVMLVNSAGTHLLIGAAPRLPAAYTEAIDPLVIGPEMGACGAAVHHRRRVVCADLERHPNWVSVRDLAIEHGLRSCWSEPILALDGHVLGSFAVYTSQVHEPDQSEIDTVTEAVHVARLAIERRRSLAQQRLAAQVFEHNHDAILITDPAWRILSVNRAYTVLTGYSAKETLGRTPTFLLAPEHGEDFVRSLQSRLSDEGFWEGEVWNRRKDGSELILDESVVAITDEHGKVQHHIIVANDITERKRSEERVHHLAHYDTVTDLPNRTLLQDRLGQAIAQAEREHKHVGVLFLDLDRFKNINDSLGHHLGDRILRAVAERLGSVLRDGDTVARLGGDEFVLVLPGLRMPEDSGIVAEKLFSAMNHPFELEGHHLTVTPSIGVSVYPGDGTTSDELIRNADAAMYHAKGLGRNNYQFYQAEMNARALETLSLESELRRALEAGEFELHYQPQFDHATGELVGAESLVRWRHRERGLIPPGQFIPIAEERGLIGALGEWTLREACRQQRAWQNAGLKVVPVAVNLSAPQFHDPLLPTKIEAILRDSGVPATLLHLELTESMLMQDSETALATLRRLGAMGIRFALDDFGTGYSSLAYLHRFELHYLKIDRSFVAEITSSRDSAAIAGLIVALGKNLGLTLVAEGVETEEQRAALGALGCDRLQGYLLGRPVPAEAFARQLSAATAA